MLALPTSATTAIIFEQSGGLWELMGYVGSALAIAALGSLIAAAVFRWRARRVAI